MEIKTKEFVARDRNGELYFFTTKPKLRTDDGTFIGGGVVSDKQFLPFLEKGTSLPCEIVVNVKKEK
jgi:hypothetical protein